MINHDSWAFVSPWKISLKSVKRLFLARHWITADVTRRKRKGWAELLSGIVQLAFLFFFFFNARWVIHLQWRVHLFSQKQQTHISTEKKKGLVVKVRTSSWATDSLETHNSFNRAQKHTSSHYTRRNAHTMNDGEEETVSNWQFDPGKIIIDWNNVI